MPGGGWAIPAGFSAGVLGTHLLVYHGFSVTGLAAGLLAVSVALRWARAVRPLADPGAREPWNSAAERATLCAALAIGLAWAEQAIEFRRADRLPAHLAGQVRTVEGVIRGLPEIRPGYTRFGFRPLGETDLPGMLRVYWYRNAPRLAPGETWRLELRMKPPWAEVNFQGADRERDFFAAGVGALATVRSGASLPVPVRGPPWDRWRHDLREKLVEWLPDVERRGLALALTIADRSALTETRNAVLIDTGTAHLLAISGLHVGLAALCGFGVGRFVVALLPLGLRGGSAYPWCLLAGSMAALAYAAMAGFGTSTVRALVMLLVVQSAFVARRRIGAWQGWMIALAGVLAIDPLAPLRAGFWLSFGAVAALIAAFGPRCGRRPGRAGALIRAQLAVVMVTLPMAAFWFQAASLAGLGANLVAIPWVSFVVVPSLLAGLAAWSLGADMAAPIFTWAALAADGLMVVLDRLSQVPGARLDLPQPSWPVAALATLGGAALLLPPGLPAVRLVALWFLPLLIAERPVSPGALRVEVLDAGQGSAVLVASGERLLLYDTGPGDGESFDRVQPVIAPAIGRSHPRAPDLIIVSHGDLDHAGGLESLRRRYPGVPVHARMAGHGGAHGGGPGSNDGIAACHDGLTWRWGPTRLRVLHPSPWLPYLGNDASCVLSVTNGNVSVLLPGDVSDSVEARLVREGLGRHALLVVPHHGSASSSSAALLTATSPRAAVASAGPGNRFGFPRPEVRARYRRSGIPLYSTGDCGALRFELAADGEVTATSARRVRDAPWRWPAAAGCP